MSADPTCRSDLLATIDGVHLHEIRCHARSSGPGPAETTDRDEVALPQRGLFVVHDGRRTTAGDPTRAIGFRAGARYRVSHPADCGDHCTVLSVDCAELGGGRDLLGFLRRLGAGAVPVDARVEWWHRRLLLALRRRQGDALAPTEAAAHLVDAVVALADPTPATPAPASRRALARDLLRLVDDSYADNLSLAELAARLGASAFHCARVFKQVHGTTIHRYRTQRRLGEALRRVVDGEPDLTRLALDLGFAHHSHLTNAFRRRYGVPPSAARVGEGPSIGGGD